MVAPFHLDRHLLRTAVDELAGRDLHLAEVRRRFGSPPLWARRPGFSALVKIILEQQVSLASARAAFERLAAAAQPVEPRTFLGLDDRELLAIGFSRQKASYCRELARAILAGDLDLAALEHTEAEAARGELLARRGVGPWTADIYLLMALGHRDVWPSGDLALARAMRTVKRLEGVPDGDEQGRLAEAWRPWRSVAARLLWHHYLERKANGGDP